MVRLSSVAGATKTRIGAAIVGLIVLVALAAPLIAPYGPDAQNLSLALKGPSGAHLFGTDQFGRDVLSRVIYSARLDLQIAFIATIFCFVLGTLLGLIGGYFGGAADQLIGRLIDVVIAFPAIVAIIALIAFQSAPCMPGS